MKKKLKIPHNVSYTIYFPAGILHSASSIGSEYRLSFQAGMEKVNRYAWGNKKQN